MSVRFCRAKCPFNCDKLRGATKRSQSSLLLPSSRSSASSHCFNATLSTSRKSKKAPYLLVSAVLEEGGTLSAIGSRSGSITMLCFFRWKLLSIELRRVCRSTGVSFASEGNVVSDGVALTVPFHHPSADWDGRAACRRSPWGHGTSPSLDRGQSGLPSPNGLRTCGSNLCS